MKFPFQKIFVPTHDVLNGMLVRECDEIIVGRISKKLPNLSWVHLKFNQLSNYPNEFLGIRNRNPFPHSRATGQNLIHFF